MKWTGALLWCERFLIGSQGPGIQLCCQHWLSRARWFTSPRWWKVKTKTKWLGSSQGVRLPGPNLRPGFEGAASCKKEGGGKTLKPQTAESEERVELHSSCVSVAWPFLTWLRWAARDREREWKNWENARKRQREGKKMRGETRRMTDKRGIQEGVREGQSVRNKRREGGGESSTSIPATVPGGGGCVCCGGGWMSRGAMRLITYVKRLDLLTYYSTEMTILPSLTLSFSVHLPWPCHLVSVSLVKCCYLINKCTVD